MKPLTSARVSQILFLILFLVLFLKTEYRGSDTIDAAVNAFFRADPLVAATYILAAKSFTLLLLPALLVLIFSALLGRFFCGWICPLGTCLDLTTGHIRKRNPLRFLKGNLKYWILAVLLFAALFGTNLAGLLDPIAILVRGLAFVLHPLLGDAVRSSWVGLYDLIGAHRDALAPGYAVFRDTFLPFRETFYPLAWLSALLLGGIFFLERYERRNWYRNLCPLGTLLGLAGRFSIFRRLPERACSDCGECRKLCPTSFDRDILQRQDCVLCMECQLRCPSNRVRFAPSWPGAGGGALIPERRYLLGGLLSGFLLSRFVRFRDPVAQASVLRPPGVRTEEDFLARCVRCGECMKVCLRSALYPAVLQAGAEGLYTPVLVPRLGYCEYNCTLCGQVCPTGAIPDLPREEKKREVIGKAVFDKDRCLPFARKENCIVCEEHCPIPAKAIRAQEREETAEDGSRIRLHVPYVVEEICNGCGICENVCPVEGVSAIRVFAVEDRSPIRVDMEEYPEGEEYVDPYL